MLKDKDVLCYCDNQNAAYAFVKIGSKNAHITKVAVDVCTWAYINNTNTFFQYIRTDLNPAVDSLTRENWFQKEPTFTSPLSVDCRYNQMLLLSSAATAIVRLSAVNATDRTADGCRAPEDTRRS